MIYTYAIRDLGSGLTKIGKSGDPVARRRDLSKAGVVKGELSFVAIWPRDIEGAIHEVFWHHREFGEWFGIPQEVENLFARGIFGETIEPEEAVKSAVAPDFSCQPQYSGSGLERLTKKQLEVLQFISDFIYKEGFPPSSREIQNHFAWSSQTAAICHLKALEKKGVISRHEGVGRSIKILANITPHEREATE